jgi:hypothetical protein
MCLRAIAWITLARHLSPHGAENVAGGRPGALLRPDRGPDLLLPHRRWHGYSDRPEFR